VPDLSVYRLDRVPTTPDGKVDDDFWTPADVAIEIASPGQSANHMTFWVQTLTGPGVQVVLIVEPR
jgi:Uma2 family endonuclease